MPWLSEPSWRGGLSAGHEHRGPTSFERSSADVGPRVVRRSKRPDGIGEGAVVRLHPGRLGLRAIDAEHELPAPLHDLDDLAGETSVPAARHGDEHHVPVQRAAVPSRRDEHVVLPPRPAEQRRNEPVSFRFQVQDPGYGAASSVRPRLGTLAAALSLHHRSGQGPRLPRGAFGCATLAVRRFVDRGLEAVRRSGALMATLTLGKALNDLCACVYDGSLWLLSRNLPMPPHRTGLPLRQLLQGEAGAVCVAQRARHGLDLHVHDGNLSSSLRCRRPARSTQARFSPGTPAARSSAPPASPGRACACKACASPCRCART